PFCLWCKRPFCIRTTGGSEQRFCSRAHRHEFGTAARRWAVLVIEVGLITVDTLKAIPASVRAVGGALQEQGKVADAEPYAVTEKLDLQRCGCPRMVDPRTPMGDRVEPCL